MKADMHVHTTYSDGVCSLSEVIEIGKKKKLDFICITDHDTLDAIEENSTIKKGEIDVYVGIEVSTYYKGQNVHILGYFYDNPTKEIIDYCNNMHKEREERAKEIIKRLKDFYSIVVDYDEIYKNAKGVIGRPHIAKAIANKYNITEKETFDKYLNNSSKAYISASKLETKDAIELLHRNNAIAVWAHPILNKGKFDEEEIINFGIDGIEGLYPKNSMNDTIKYRDIAIKHNLLFTAGSDFHGDDYHSDIGTCCVEDEDIEKFFKYLDIKKGMN